MPAPNTCCLGCSLRDGARIIAVMCIVQVIYGLTTQIWSLAIIVTESGEDTAKALKEAGNLKTGLVVYFTICILLELIQLILSALLYYGAKVDDRSKCRPWLYFNLFRLLLVLFTMIATPILLALLFGLMLPIFLPIVVGIGYYVFQFYYFLKVRQYIYEHPTTSPVPMVTTTAAQNGGQLYVAVHADKPNGEP